MLAQQHFAGSALVRGGMVSGRLEALLATPEQHPHQEFALVADRRIAVTGGDGAGAAGLPSVRWLDRAGLAAIDLTHAGGEALQLGGGNGGAPAASGLPDAAAASGGTAAAAAATGRLPMPVYYLGEDRQRRTLRLAVDVSGAPPGWAEAQQFRMQARDGVGGGMFMGLVGVKCCGCERSGACLGRGAAVSHAGKDGKGAGGESRGRGLLAGGRRGAARCCGVSAAARGWAAGKRMLQPQDVLTLLPETLLPEPAHPYARVHPSLHCRVPSQDLRSLMPALTPDELSVAGHAMALSQWHQVGQTRGQAGCAQSRRSPFCESTLCACNGSLSRLRSRAYNASPPLVRVPAATGAPVLPALRRRLHACRRRLAAAVHSAPGPPLLPTHRPRCNNGVREPLRRVGACSGLGDAAASTAAPARPPIYSLHAALCRIQSMSLPACSMLPPTHPFIHPPTHTHTHPRSVAVTCCWAGARRCGQAC